MRTLKWVGASSISSLWIMAEILPRKDDPPIVLLFCGMDTDITL